MANKTKTPPVSLPHSWDIENWPRDVYPGTSSRARYLIRVHRNDLLAAGALTRVGRELVVLGARYSRWLEKKSADVPTYIPNVGIARAEGEA